MASQPDNAIFLGRIGGFRVGMDGVFDVILPTVLVIERPLINTSRVSIAVLSGTFRDLDNVDPLLEPIL